MPAERRGSRHSRKGIALVAPLFMLSLMEGGAPNDEPLNCRHIAFKKRCAFVLLATLHVYVMYYSSPFLLSF